MPPTIVKPLTESGAKSKDKDKQVDLALKVKYSNTLPDVPFDPKFLAFPFQPQRYIDYKPTSLEKSHKWDILTDADLGIHIDLIDPDVYVKHDEDSTTLHPADERLLEDEIQSSTAEKRSQRHNKSVPWLRKTVYIAPEFTRYGQTSERQETKVGYQIKKKFQEETVYKDKQSQVAAITKTFEDVKRPVSKHYSKAGVVAIQEFPVLPDFEMWKFGCAQVIFDSDPAPTTYPHNVQTEMMSQALIKGMQDETGEQFVAYFLPTEETLQKRQQDLNAGIDYEDDQVYEHKLQREYTWTVKSKAAQGFDENYFFVFRDDGVYYNELETRVRLSRRRTKDGTIRATNSRLLMKQRPLTELELQQQEARLLHLQALVEEADEAAEETAADDNEDNADAENVDEPEEEQEEDEGDSTLRNIKKEKTDESSRRRVSRKRRRRSSDSDEEDDSAQSSISSSEHNNDDDMDEEDN